MLRLLVFYILFLATFIFVLLFGECTAFEGTFIARAHNFLQDGLPAALSRGLVVLCGQRRGQRLLDTFTDVCVNRPNPALQVVYTALVTAGYTVFLHSAWPLIPGNPYVSEIHCFLGPAATCVGLCVFLLTCFSDPGTVTAVNVDAHLAAYAFDDFLYTPKRCPTMRLTCPPRSKFSRVTNRRVARFDHFCAWMNNDIGENNYRFFLAFLASHVVLCAYGAWLMFALVAGEVVRHGVLDAHIELDGSDVPMSQAPGALVQWVVFTYLDVSMLALFLSLTCVLVASFLGYHLYLVSRNETTNEAWKRKDMRRYLVECAQYDAAQQEGEADPPRRGGDSDAAAAPAEQGGGKERRSRWRRLLTCRCRRRQVAEPGSAAPEPPALPAEVMAAIEAKSRNVYDRGLVANLVEVLLPRSQRRAARGKAHGD